MELEEEIEKLNYLKTIRDLKDYVKDNNCMLADAIEVALNQLTKQEKMIDLMLEELAHQFTNYEPCWLEFEEPIKCDKQESCKECIKQYFENKANKEAE